MSSWNNSSWQYFKADQQPEWIDIAALENVKSTLESLPSLVFSGETRRLKEELKEVNRGNAFILQAGDCSESFADCNGPKIHNYLRVLLQMALIISHKTNKKIIKIGRIAGQYAKPRSSNYELVDGQKIHAYRGDMVNNHFPSKECRMPDPKRLLEGYYRSAATLNLIRAFTQGGYTEIKHLNDWKVHSFANEISQMEDFIELENELSISLAEINSCTQSILNDEIYISHEGLLLDYEEAFTRIDTITGDFYNTAAHSLWIGDRTRNSSGAHAEYFSGIGNPVGIKVGSSCDLDDLVELIKKINSQNEEGKVILILRLGVKNIDKYFPKIITKIKSENLNVIWSCDPMHGNTFTYGSYKVRDIDDILIELKSFFSICKSCNVIPGGVHLEITSGHVTECIGGLSGLSLDDLASNYVSKVDPRLNAAQALETAFEFSKLI